MLLKVSTIVRKPHATLKEAVGRQNFRARLTNQGALVVPLRIDRQSSSNLYPDEWIEKPQEDTGFFRYNPIGLNGILHAVYEFPDVLAGTSYQLLLEGAEKHHNGTYCQIITSGAGLPLRPFRRQSDNTKMAERPALLVFSFFDMAALRLHVNDGQCHLTICSTTIQAEDGLVIATTRGLWRNNDPSIATQGLPALPAELAAWQPAVTALGECWKCEATTCGGHYRLP